ncbi:PRA1 family protein 3-like isoform X1 [Eriocheir sinensis]|uniref:PRA1 family protein 3-like isoform X1 n=2 Tax=Eriocheir sinensis TaxID=95602 RepID=UPI0021C7B3F4|nr:PRA1 family protein 3-like isoform X1 [Eriocheir sinensis]XP_050721828.1 PRA1 family protein 3-like isoform X1 [Eriocheir sinensis]XP_050721829.1 PRA1 family protein 3-like isoform X1 [Eriocheir sinensis]XP_050721830.1 PRA1 family protein 3-like isoform X1 [Eriocheir sinensis]XP_050721831.1 PRA1 family protein 3-like isoform X1 [Eriocheir sinensis]XP_050721832.1 PRA1 family protein 3-like isoform X1 [Eriocheir sinensis]XP_050721833.1 PRA1 family protein 3-like isoform X1 [Eriocheir sinensi
MAEAEGVSVSPLRSLDDFLMESARFQVPNLKDPEKWANRVLQNLLYYQTNYFLTCLAIFAVVGVIHPTKMFCGMTAVGLAFGLFYYLTNNKMPAAQFKKNHPVLSLLGVVLAAYFMVYLLGSVLVFLMGILLPITVIFLHASMRLRNLKNKLMNKVEYLGMKRTPMGVILEALGLEQDFFMSKVNIDSGSAKLLEDFMSKVPSHLK